jgi:ribosomal protein S18 acetylase RimI-like enzyme
MKEETLGQQYAFRQYTPAADIPHLSHLLAAVEDHDHDGEDNSEATLREQLTWPNHHPEQDCWVIEAPGSSYELIGYCSVFAQTPLRSTLYVTVHPAWRRRGLGKILLTRALRRAREIGASQVTIYANAHNTAANAFLQKRGFRLRDSAWVLHAPADLALEEPSWFFRGECPWIDEEKGWAYKNV